MDTSSHNLEALFQQLGLSTSEAAISAFITNNRLPNNIPLEKAACWSAVQAEFIHEAIEMDSDWAGVVDLLDAQLRH